MYKQEHFVSFDVAKKLKNKGFDWECDYIYYDAKNTPIKSKLVIKSDWNHLSMLGFPISAPTLHTATDWLREIHKLHIETIYDGECWMTNIRNLKMMEERKGKTRIEAMFESATAVGKLFKTYEAAQMAAIEKAIELI